MSPLERRLQLLLDRERFEKLEAEARRSHRSVAAVIREAIDLRFASDDPVRAAAGRRLLESSAVPTGPEPDWSETKKALERAVEHEQPGS